MKKVYVLFAAVMMFGLTFAGVASAKVMEFDYISVSVNVPNGWKVAEDPDNYTVGLIAPDESAAMTLSGIAEPKMSLKKFAESIVKELGGKKLTKANENSYTFTFVNKNGVASKAIVSGDEDYIVMITATGEHKDFDKIIDSLEYLE